LPMPWLLNPGLIVDPVISGFYDAVKVEVLFLIEPPSSSSR
jgi:hypothetical protein